MSVQGIKSHLIDALREAEHLEKMLSAEPTINFIKDGVNVQHWGVKLLAASLAQSLNDLGAKNYFTMDIETAEGPVTVTVQLKGKKSPADRQAELQEALRPFAELAKSIDFEVYNENETDILVCGIGDTIPGPQAGDFRRAAELLNL